MRTATISVPEIFCETCKTSIEGALMPLGGVRRAVVDIDSRRVTVDFDDTVVGAPALIAAIEEQGYDVPARE